MTKPPTRPLYLGILAAAVFAACLGMLALSSLAQISGKTGAEKVGEAKPTAAKPKSDAAKAEPPKGQVPTVKETAEKLAATVEPPGADEPAKEEVVDYSALLFVFVMATIIGLGVVSRVSRLLHTPLMSLTNAISAIAVVGAIIVTGSSKDTTIRIMGAVALFASMTNVVSGFLITDRMLKMFKQTRTEKK
jgi:H+-translocating NAD(P) transhydrogenase subunit alpha